MKKWKLKFLTSLSITFLSIPVISTVSCSSSLEAQLNDLLNDENLFSLEINEIAIRQALGKSDNDPILIKDLFVSNVSAPQNKNVVIINESEKLKSWNENLSINDAASFSVVPKIKTIIFPSIDSLDSENKLNYIEVVVDVSSGPYSNRTVTKKLDLSNINNLIESPNNYFDWSADEEPENNVFYKCLRTNILNYLKYKSISINDSMTIDELENQLSIKLIKETNDNTINLYQNDLCISFDSKQDGKIYLNLYSNSKIVPNNDVINNEISLKLSYKIDELK